MEGTPIVLASGQAGQHPVQAWIADDYGALCRRFGDHTQLVELAGMSDGDRSGTAIVQRGRRKSGDWVVAGYGGCFGSAVVADAVLDQ
jgi:hypothetical protein